MTSDANSTSTDQAAPLTSLPLFYKNLQPINRTDHARSALRRNIGYGFTRQANAIPVSVAELAKASQCYPVVFSADEAAFPIVILGLRDQENLFVDADGGWLEGMYVPAYVRRYPFLLSTAPDTDQLLLCIDDTEHTLEPEGEQRFFDDAGEPTPLARSVMDFCQACKAAGDETTAFVQALKQAGVLRRHQVEIALPAGDRRFQFSGYQIIDNEKLAAVDDSTFLEWRRKGWLAFIYAHLLSEPNWQRLADLLNKRLGAA